MHSRKLKQTNTYAFLTREAIVYDTSYHHDEFEKYYETVRRFLPGRYYVSSILPIIREEFNQKKISADQVRAAFNGRKIAPRYFILLSTLYFLLEKNVPIPELDGFPDFFQADYLKINQKAA